MKDKTIFRIVLGISVFVCIAVVILNQKVLPRIEPTPSFVFFLPKLNALLNSTCAVLLICSFYFIRNKKVAVHKRINLIAFFLSASFLVSYIVYHWLIPAETRFPADNPWKYLYYFILVSHIVLAAVVLPLVLLSFHRGLQMQVEKHRKIVRWSFPIWLYVAVTGVAVYLMISPYYNF